MNEVFASDIACALNAKLDGPDLRVTGVSSLSNPRAHTLCYRIASWSGRELPRPILVISATSPGPEADGVTIIQVDHPRDAYAHVVETILIGFNPRIAPSALVGNKVTLGRNVTIGEGAIIEEAVSIGDDTYVDAGVLITRGSRIGMRCRIGAHTVIGNEGLGSFKTADGRLRNVRHMGGVFIGDDVEIGALCAVARGTIDDTVIGDNTHIGPMVNVGHNVIIGKCCQIAGRSHLSGSAVIEDYVKLWANSTLKDGVRIGEFATVGMGAVVKHDVPPGQTVATLPAVELKRLARFLYNFRWGR